VEITARVEHSPAGTREAASQLTERRGPAQ
jgi:hypothetical protein